MRRVTYCLPIHESAARSILSLWPRLAVQVAAAHLWTWAGLAVLVVSVGPLLLPTIAPALQPLRLWQPGGLTLGVFFLVLLPVFFALEEALHVGICVRLGQANASRGLVIIHLDAGRFPRILLGGVASRFERSSTSRPPHASMRGRRWRSS